MVTTRKRSSIGGEAPARDANKRRRRDQAARSPPKVSAAAAPIKSPTKPSPLPKGRRGHALLAAAGVAVPVAAPLASPPKPARSPAPITAAAGGASPQQRQSLRRLSTGSSLLLRQPLPKSYTVLEDFFAALQLNHGMLRKRGQRCTYQTLRAAVEEQTGKRFLVSHLAQLQFLLPDVISLEYVRLPVAPHSSRTEPHLAIQLGPMPAEWDHPCLQQERQQQQQQAREQEQQQIQEAEDPLLKAALAVAGGARAASPSAAGPRGGSRGGAGGPAAGASPLPLRQLVHYRLAQHLLATYRRHLGEAAERLRAEGDTVGAQEVEAQLAAVPQPHVQGSSGDGAGSGSDRVEEPVLRFAAGFLDSPAAEVPQHPLPRHGLPAGASPAAVSAHLHQPPTPATPATGQTAGKPPLPPSSAAQLGQRRLSFGAAGIAPLVPTAAAPSPRLHFKAMRPGSSTPLDKLEKQLTAGTGGREAAGRGLAGIPEALPQQLKPAEPATERQPQQGAAAAEREEQWGGRVMGEEEWRASLPEGVWDSLPDAAKRLSMDGIMSLDAHKAVKAAAQRHEAGSSVEAQEARALRSALGMLPKTYMRLQRIFGLQGPNAIKLQQVVARLRSADETFSEAEVEAQLRLLVEHAPECCSLRPFGSCGTPAVWWDRRADKVSNGGVYRRLKGVAERRHSLVEQPAAAAVRAA